ncbi:Hypothetical protein IALB_1205 [Ignavibacterium album JCM 16511]|uniref:VWFA domain-containing protein n=1 Tax=Ignavibacterium album (strain DSM 19864 / JCM 16511 / NBRC 101810 / Mat9-16) TaxID=945713 RepID=I0AIV9_IGNAJ|nr:hypothetical protein [Ignavibacterium album]AFH48916.1 Hypothetical protein IALB_1205 [Ignavibacterium album JCM 16511]
MTVKKIIQTLFVLLIPISQIIFNTSCNSDVKSEQNESSAISYNKYFKNFNITILLDLSDRISNRKNPGQYKKDIVFVNNVLDAFKSYLKSKGVVQSEDRIKIIFYPYSNYEIYQQIADSLNINFSEYGFPERKKLFEEISSIYNRQLNNLYAFASNAKSYPGSDLFNYFKHRVTDDCIIADSSFINLLVILTDGYLYDVNSKYQQGNRFSFLIPEANHIQIFRKMNNWEEVFEKNDYGIINLSNDLSDLYVLVGEFNPASNSPKDFDILKKYWSGWLESQNVKKDHYKILKTDLNTLNRNVVFSFFNKIISQ